MSAQIDLQFEQGNSPTSATLFANTRAKVVVCVMYQLDSSLTFKKCGISIGDDCITEISTTRPPHLKNITHSPTGEVTPEYDGHYSNEQQNITVPNGFSSKLFTIVSDNEVSSTELHNLMAFVQVDGYVPNPFDEDPVTMNGVYLCSHMNVSGINLNKTITLSVVNKPAIQLVGIESSSADTSHYFDPQSFGEEDATLGKCVKVVYSDADMPYRPIVGKNYGIAFSDGYAEKLYPEADPDAVKEPNQNMNFEGGDACNFGLQYCNDGDGDKTETNFVSRTVTHVTSQSIRVTQTDPDSNSVYNVSIESPYVGSYVYVRRWYTHGYYNNFFGKADFFIYDIYGGESELFVFPKYHYEPRNTFTFDDSRCDIIYT